MLIITNGDMALERIRALGLDAEVLPWRDVLHDGPVRPAPTLEDQSAARSLFLAEMSGRPVEDVAASMAARDALFRSAGAAGAVQLWFEHDLYDQLQLVQILDAAAGMAPRPALALVQAEAHLTMMPDADFAKLPSRAAPVPDGAFDDARRVWAAFMAPDPTALDALAQESFALPYLGPALKRLLAEYPDAHTGLPASLAMATSMLMAIPMTLAEVFRQMLDAEAAAFMGDLSFARLIDDIAQAETPLIAAAAGGPLAPVAGAAPEAFRQQATLTPFGQSVLMGAENHVRRNGIDRWIGGVHLTGTACYWRSAETGRLLAPDGAPLAG